MINMQTFNILILIGLRGKAHLIRMQIRNMDWIVRQDAQGGIK